jgi:hypothetical protein
MSWTFSRQVAGVALRVQGSDQAVLGWLELDFDAFPKTSLSPAAGAVELSVRLQPHRPPAGLRESFRGPYGVCFDHGSVRHIRYPGPVWVRFDFATERGEVLGEDPLLVYERLYLSLLSRLGERLESVGLHRIHGLALGSPWGSCLFLMRAGVGKSELAHSLLQRPGWTLISEDTPLLDRCGRMHPFPFRLGLRRGPLGQPKTLIPASRFPIERLATTCRHIFAGAWITGEHPEMGPLTRTRLLALLVRDGVVGIGVPQVAELFLRPGARNIVGKAALATGRLRAVLPLLKAPPRTLYLTPQAERNADCLERCLAGR